MHIRAMHELCLHESNTEMLTLLLANRLYNPTCHSPCISAIICIPFIMTCYLHIEIRIIYQPIISDESFCQLMILNYYLNNNHMRSRIFSLSPPCHPHSFPTPHANFFSPHLVFFVVVFFLFGYSPEFLFMMLHIEVVLRHLFTWACCAFFYSASSVSTHGLSKGLYKYTHLVFVNIPQHTVRFMYIQYFFSLPLTFHLTLFNISSLCNLYINCSWHLD